MVDVQSSVPECGRYTSISIPAFMKVVGRHDLSFNQTVFVWLIELFEIIIKSASGHS
jgi:hypothetical protein